LIDLPHLPLLDAELRARYDARVAEFGERKRFVGCAGLELTATMCETIAAMACLMILRPRAKVFPRLHSVLVYPDAFLVPGQADDDGIVWDEVEERVGESWDGDKVILSWPDVEAALDGDEVNVVVHEFAHQLDAEKAGAEGATPSLTAERWEGVMSAEYARLQRHRRPPVLDPYGAESPAEFFAVATEAYFQRGAELKRHHPALYDLLRDYYLLDTAKAPKSD
jgi:Mlc titration factor MtfA (ptsG expression regulator)